MSYARFIAKQLLAVFTVLILILSTTLCFIPILAIGLLKLFPNKRWQIACTQRIDVICSFWCSMNNYYVDAVYPIHWEISGIDQFRADNWYLIVSNHQSWLDIVVLQRILNHKIPILKFFIKDELKWIPILGFCWWAMGCPFMKRYSKEYLAKNPHKQGTDLMATRKAIETFKEYPASIMNFVEGTRFTPEKKESQHSPYQFLLKPKAGGIRFIINAMGEKINCLTDVTIVYPDQQHSLWDFLCRRVSTIKVTIRQLPIPSQFSSSQAADDQHSQNEFKDWLNQQWMEKDQLIASMQSLKEPQ